MLKQRIRMTPWLAALSLAGPLVLLTGCPDHDDNTPTPVPTPTPTPTPPPSTSTRFTQVNLVSDIPGLAAFTDPDLVNPWGIDASPTGPFWIADNGRGRSTVYLGNGVKQSTVVNIPSPTSPTEGAVTGLVFNGTGSFILPNGDPANFIFATEDGTLTAWNTRAGANAVQVADRSSIPAPDEGAIYKGLALAPCASGSCLFATNFRAGTIDVFDSHFAFTHLAGSFADPNLPAGFAPFGIEYAAGQLFVTYARQDADKEDDVPGVGSGIVDVFSTQGTLVRRFATGSAAGGTETHLDSPWGMVVAPADFGGFAGALLVGNFGEGTINAFNLTTGAFLGQMQNSAGTAPIVIPGLWGLMFGNGSSYSGRASLFFTAGLGDPPDFKNNLESHGLFGVLRLVP